ncbi:1-phosphatidylinositol-4,5-bisphosphate phosphodiesterase beta-2 [Gossypium australe]|uniref:1-phosphatidylinositol-4,5-bisphosphate phosphodiesterase beta-2 n=1 Tax=Gossypium australe TaxID=47621 RepID=A0A5B6V958_9ROSI|nr:1-phosphatidylinositol-4,5-bisphosphate phosphodiesterase beta-2 [Gossypium australe]
MATSTVEYWLEATERIMDELDLSPEEKVKGMVVLLRNEVYQWWLTVRDSVTAEDLTWEYVKTAYQKKYVDTYYIDAQRNVFLGLVQRNKSVAEYEARFLRLSRYTRGVVATEHERCVRFKDRLRDGLKLMLAPQQEREFSVLVEKAKVAERIKDSMRQNRDKDRNRDRRNFGSSKLSEGLRKRPRVESFTSVTKPAMEKWDCPCA